MIRSAELGTGGMILSRTDAVSMVSEDLSISLDKVTVDYVFKNTDRQGRRSARRLPDARHRRHNLRQALHTGRPVGQFPRFRGERRRQAGQARARAEGVRARHRRQASCSRPTTCPSIRSRNRCSRRWKRLPEADCAGLDQPRPDLHRHYDDGAGWKDVRTPLWSLKSTYWWNSTFPAGKEVKVSHRYKPSVGGTSGLTFFYDNKFQRLTTRTTSALLHRRRVREGGARKRPRRARKAIRC